MDSPVLQNVYVKDDFFDSLSCDALDRGSQNGKTKFSEQMRKDTEVYLAPLEKNKIKDYETIYSSFLVIFEDFVRVMRFTGVFIMF